MTAFWAVDQHLRRARTSLVVARRSPHLAEARLRASLEAMLMACWLMGVEP